MRLFLVIFAVEALAASWIEINSSGKGERKRESKPLRLRGLKSVGERIATAENRSKPLRLRGLKLPMLTVPSC